MKIDDSETPRQFLIEHLVDKVVVFLRQGSFPSISLFGQIQNDQISRVPLEQEREVAFCGEKLLITNFVHDDVRFGSERTWSLCPIERH